MTIAGLSGVQPADAGVASGLINTARQIGGAIGIAAASSVAATSTSNYLQTHAAGPAALDHGLQSGLYLLLGLLVIGMVAAAVLVKPQARPIPAAAPLTLEDGYEVAREAA